MSVVNMPIADKILEKQCDALAKTLFQELCKKSLKENKSLNNKQNIIEIYLNTLSSLTYRMFSNIAENIHEEDFLAAVDSFSEHIVHVIKMSAKIRKLGENK